jgi:plasmid stabilization system protein ParE
VNRPLILRPAFEEDVASAYRWYEKQSAGLGTELVRAIDASLAAISRNPGLYPVIYRNARRALLRRFPYALFFVAGAEKIDVVALSHNRRSPRLWRKRL